MVSMTKRTLLTVIAGLFLQNGGKVDAQMPPKIEVTVKHENPWIELAKAGGLIWLEREKARIENECKYAEEIARAYEIRRKAEIEALEKELKARGQLELDKAEALRDLAGKKCTIK